MRVLVCLAQSPGTTVTRERLLEAGWLGAPYVSDEALTKAVSLLRSALTECSVDREVIRTVPRSGYTLMAQPEFDAATVAKLRDGLAHGNRAPTELTETRRMPLRMPLRLPPGIAGSAARLLGVFALCALAFVVGLNTGDSADNRPDNSRVSSIDNSRDNSTAVREFPLRLRLEGPEHLPELLAVFGRDMQIVSDSTWVQEGEPGKLRRRIAMR